MLKQTFLALLCVLSSHQLMGQTTPPSQDTIILQRLDTCFAFGHVIQKGQTLYSLSKIYKTTLTSIHAINPNLMETELAIGDQINMPLNTKMVVGQEDLHPDHSAVLIYHVGQGETLFAIAKRWLKVDTKYIKSINNLRKASLPLNMPLVLGWMDMRYQKAQVIDSAELEIAERDAALLKASKVSVQGMEAIIEQGKAIWKASKVAGDKPYILHRKAKLNSLVQIYNPMTGKKIHAKVVGRIPERNYDDNVMVVLTPYLAEALKARDKAFFVKMKYTM